MVTTLSPTSVPPLRLPRRTEAGNYFVANYPPFSTWQPNHIPALTGALERPPRPEALGLYVHIPFCRQRCHYCYFRVYPRRSSADVDLYIDAVLKELSLYQSQPALRERAFNSVYFGGGSPSYLTVEQIERLLGGLQTGEAWREVEECTFECEPGTMSLEKFRVLRKMGVTRVSLGFQTLHDEILRRSGRDVRVADCLEAYQQARAAGFDEINIDLLAGLEGETADTWQRTMDQVLALAPDCISIYQLELTYNSKLHASRQAGREVPLPTWPEKRRMVQQAFRQCEEFGYLIGSGYMAIRHPQWWRFVYTVEHFWRGADLLALGETAFGHIQGVHYQNTDTFAAYTAEVAAGRLPVRRALPLGDEEKLRREVILLLKTGRLEAAYFRAKFGVDLRRHFADELETLEQAGLLVLDSEGVSLTREGLLEVDWLLPSFYLPEHRGVRYT